MEIKIDREKLRGKSLLVATPMYGGNCKGEFAACLINLQRLCSNLGVPVEFLFVYNASLITRGRNDLADRFLTSYPDCTHLLFIDADLMFEPADVIACLASEKELVGGPYPMKTIDWEFVRDLSLAHPTIPPEDLKRVARFFHFNYNDVQPTFQLDNFLEVHDISTGFMMIERSVFHKMAERWPNNRYKSNYAEEIVNGKTRYVYNYFHAGVEDGVYLSEDYWFCARWRDLGGKVWLAPWMAMRHIGDYTYGGLGISATSAAEKLVANFRGKKSKD